jgi:hypothetical protein
VRRHQVLFPLVVAAFAAALGGCGQGAQRGATVSVYAVPPLCQGARQAVDAADRRAGDLKVRVLCLRRVERGGRADLATAGANTRRATEDSSSVAYLEAPGPAAPFSKSIVENAGVAWVKTNSAVPVARRILKALEGDSSSPRKAVLDEVG